MNGTLTSLFIISHAHPWRIVAAVFVFVFFMALVVSFIGSKAGSPSVLVARSLEQNQLVSCFAVKSSTQTSVIFKLTDSGTNHTEIAGRPMEEVIQAHTETLDLQQAAAVFNWLDRNHVQNEAALTLKLAFVK